MDRIAMLQQIIDANPGDGFARYGLAMEYANADQTETALAQFDQLIASQPDYTAAYQMSGQLLARQGRVEEATARLQAGVACAGRAGNQHAKNEMQSLLDEIAY